MKNVPKNAATSSSITALAPATVRDRRIRSGSSGLAVRDSRMTNATRAAIAAVPVTIVSTDVQPTSLVRMIVNTPSISAPVTRIAPRMSAPLARPRPGSSSSRRTARIPVTMPIGRLTKKIQCQLSAAVRTPPASRPIDAPAEATKL